MSMRQSSLAAAALVGLVGLPGRADAAGYYLVGVGSRCGGRAGACVVGADALSASAYNPAALIRASRPQVLVDVAGVDQRVRFARQAEPENDLTFDEVRNSALPMVIPHLNYVHPIRADRLAVGVGFSSPYAPLLTYPEAGAQRFTLVESTILSGEVGPTLAWAPVAGLSLGASVAWTFLTMDQTLVSHVNPQGFAATDDPNYDIPTRLSVADLGSITGDVGVLYDRGGGWAAGASLSLPGWFSATGPMTTDLSQNIYARPDNPVSEDAVIVDDQAEDPETSLALTLPLVVRAGVLLRPGEGWEVELDGVWERWSSMASLVLTDIDMEIETTFAEPSRVTDDVILPLSMRDALSGRLGVERSWSGARARGGVYYETSAAAEGYASVLLPEGQKVGYSLGGGARLRPGLWVDLGWTQGVVLPQEIVSSQVFQVQIDPLSGAVSRGKVVGRGELAVLNSVAVLGLRWSPGATRGAAAAE